MLVTLGDLIDDIVVRPHQPIRPATDTPAVISRRRGGSAANVAAVAGQLGASCRFVGQVGADSTGERLVTELAGSGVDVGFVRRNGTTGAIVVLLDVDGERTMLTDRRTCVELRGADRAWLDGASALHVPLYSFSGPPIADTALAAVRHAHERGVAVSIDLSSTGLIAAMDPSAVESMLATLEPAVVFANEDEAEALDVAGPAAGALTVVKRGSEPVILYMPTGERIDVPAPEIGAVADTTGAGDAFAAGFLTTGMGGGATWAAAPAAACRRGHDAARELIVSRSSR